MQLAGQLETAPVRASQIPPRGLSSHWGACNRVFSARVFQNEKIPNFRSRCFREISGRDEPFAITIFDLSALTAVEKARCEKRSHLTLCELKTLVRYYHSARPTVVLEKPNFSFFLSLLRYLDEHYRLLGNLDPRGLRRADSTGLLDTLQTMKHLVSGSYM